VIFLFEISALSFLWCFDLVGWLTGGSSSLQIPVPLTPKGSLPEQVEEETEQEMVKLDSPGKQPLKRMC